MNNTSRPPAETDQPQRSVLAIVKTRKKILLVAAALLGGFLIGFVGWPSANPPTPSPAVSSPPLLPEAVPPPPLSEGAPPGGTPAAAPTADPLAQWRQQIAAADQYLETVRQEIHRREQGVVAQQKSMSALVASGDTEQLQEMLPNYNKINEEIEYYKALEKNWYGYRQRLVSDLDKLANRPASR